MTKEIFHQSFSLRLRALQHVMQSSDHRTFDPEVLDDDSVAFAALSMQLDSESPGASQRAFAECLSVYASLIRWVNALRRAEPEASRYLTAAKLRAEEFLVETTDSVSTGFEPLFRMVAEIIAPAGLAEFKASLLSTALPFPLFPPADRRHGLFREAEIEDERLNIAFLSFTIDGEPASAINTLRPNTVYDLGLDVRVSRWPIQADALLLTPVSVEPEASYEMPRFVFPRPSGNGPFHLKDSGRLVLKLPHSIGARPYEFKYAAFFEPTASEQAVDVIGHRTLRLEGVDLTANPMSGYAEVDARLLTIRRSLRALPIPDGDLFAALMICAGLGNIAGQALSDKIFPVGTLEKPFQDKCVEMLRRNPQIGERLVQHAAVGGGITDLTFERIPIELKAKPKHLVDDAEIDQFTDQTAQYAVASGKRIGVLCILDSSPKSAPPPPVASQIGVKYKFVDQARVAIVCIVVQGGLARPSDLSK